MTTSKLNNTRTAPLDRGFLSTARFNDLYRTALRHAGNGVPFVLATESCRRVGQAVAAASLPERMPA